MDEKSQKKGKLHFHDNWETPSPEEDCAIQLKAPEQLLSRSCDVIVDVSLTHGWVSLW